MLIEPQFRSPEADRIWRVPERLKRFAAFEAELAAAQAEAGIVPEVAAAAIARVCAAAPVDGVVFDEAARAGNPAIPFVKRLTQAVAAADVAASRWVHFGATSQDVIDSANMMALAALADHLDGVLARAIVGLRDLATAHAETPIAARTVMQQATPITFGLKAALWMTGLTRAREGLASARARDMAVQLGGATGTLGALAGKGPAVRASLARRLKLADPGSCWHAERSRLIAIAGAFVVAVAAAAKVAGDVILLMQSEIGEVAEGAAAGKGGSTAMPHKRNPVDTLVPIAVLPQVAATAASLAQVHAHERAAGAWHGEWSALSTLTTLSCGAIERTADLIAGLTIDGARMKRNLEMYRGLLAAEELAAALGEALGRAGAQDRVESLAKRAIAEHGDFAALVRADQTITKGLGAARLDEILHYVKPIAAAAAEARRLLSSPEES